MQKKLQSKETVDMKIWRQGQMVHEAEICNIFYAHMVRIILLADSRSNILTDFILNLNTVTVNP